MLFSVLPRRSISRRAAALSDALFSLVLPGRVTKPMPTEIRECQRALHDVADDLHVPMQLRAALLHGSAAGGVESTGIGGIGCSDPGSHHAVQGQRCASPPHPETDMIHVACWLPLHFARCLKFVRSVRQRISNHVIAGLGAERSVAARGCDDILFAVDRVAHRR
jgi:hypothetical protein